MDRSAVARWTSMDISDLLQTGTRTPYGPPSWSRFATPTMNPVAEVSAKRVGYAAIALGVLAVLVAVLADLLGIGGHGGFGWKQGALLAVGVLVALGGVGVMRKAGSPPGTGRPGEATHPEERQ
jgi:hypothetical protein